MTGAKDYGVMMRAESERLERRGERRWNEKKKWDNKWGREVTDVTAC